MGQLRPTGVGRGTELVDRRRVGVDGVVVMAAELGRRRGARLVPVVELGWAMASSDSTQSRIESSSGRNVIGTHGADAVVAQDAAGPDRAELGLAGLQPLGRVVDDRARVVAQLGQHPVDRACRCPRSCGSRSTRRCSARRWRPGRSRAARCGRPRRRARRRSSTAGTARCPGRSRSGPRSIRSIRCCHGPPSLLVRRQDRADVVGRAHGDRRPTGRCARRRRRTPAGRSPCPSSSPARARACASGSTRRDSGPRRAPAGARAR